MDDELTALEAACTGATLSIGFWRSTLRFMAPPPASTVNLFYNTHTHPEWACTLTACIIASAGAHVEFKGNAMTLTQAALISAPPDPWAPQLLHLVLGLPLRFRSGGSADADAGLTHLVADTRPPPGGAMLPVAASPHVMTSLCRLRVLHASAPILTSLLGGLMLDAAAPHPGAPPVVLDLQDFAIVEPDVSGARAQWDAPLMPRVVQATVSRDVRISPTDLIAFFRSPIVSIRADVYRLVSVNLDRNDQVNGEVVAALCRGAFNTLTRLSLRRTNGTVTPQSLRALALCGRLQVLDVAHVQMPTHRAHIGLPQVPAGFGPGTAAQVVDALADTLADWVSAAVPVLHSLAAFDAFGATWLGELVAPLFLQPGTAPQMRDFRSSATIGTTLMRVNAAPLGQPAGQGPGAGGLHDRLALFTPRVAAAAQTERQAQSPAGTAVLAPPPLASCLHSLTLLHGFGVISIDGSAFFAALRHNTPHLRRLALGVPFASLDGPFGAAPSDGLKDVLHLLVHQLESIYFHFECAMLSPAFYAAWAAAARIEEAAIRQQAATSSRSDVLLSSRWLRELHLMSALGPGTSTAAILEAVTAIAALSLARAEAHCAAQQCHRQHSYSSHDDDRAETKNRQGLLKLSVTSRLAAAAGSDPHSAVVPEHLGHLFAATPHLEDLRLDHTAALLADDADMVTFDIIAAALPRLRVLKVGGDRVHAGALATVAAGVGKSLRSVAMQLSRIDDRDMDALCEHCPRLEFLDVSGCTSITAAALERVLEACPLQFLGVAGVVRREDMLRLQALRMRVMQFSGAPR